MIDFRRAAASRVVLICTLLAVPVEARAFDLTGAWATSADRCSQVFKKTGNQVTIARDSDIYGSGFIADANQLRGRTARCTIKSRREAADTLNLLAACSTDIMLSSVQFNLKILDNNKLSRFFPGMEGMELTYYRCAL